MGFTGSRGIKLNARLPLRGNTRLGIIRQEHARAGKRSISHRASTATSMTLGLLGLGHRLAHQLEGALLGNEAKSAKVLDSLLASGVLLATNDATVVLHEVLLDEASRGVLSGSVKNLGF